MESSAALAASSTAADAELESTWSFIAKWRREQGEATSAIRYECGNKRGKHGELSASLRELGSNCAQYTRCAPHAGAKGVARWLPHRLRVEAGLRERKTTRCKFLETVG